MALFHGSNGLRRRETEGLGQATEGLLLDPALQESPGAPANECAWNLFRRVVALRSLQAKGLPRERPRRPITVGDGTGTASLTVGIVAPCSAPGGDGKESPGYVDWSVVGGPVNSGIVTSPAAEIPSRRTTDRTVRARIPRSRRRLRRST